jgi:DNA replication and repair protein RecF
MVRELFLELFLKELKLHNFRIFQSLKLKFTEKLVIILGKNGSGKTTILEAISVLQGGSGLRRAKNEELKRNLKENYTSFGSFSNKDDEFIAGTGIIKEKRIHKLNLKTVKKPSQLKKIIPIFFLTPKIENLFLEGASEKRDYFDDIVAQFIVEHEEYLNQHKNLRRNRIKVLQTRNNDVIWLKNIEKELSNLDVIILINRLEIIKKVIETQGYFANKNLFYEFNISLIDENFSSLEKLIEQKPAIELEEIFQSKYLENRARDKESNRSNFGSHLSNFIVENLNNGKVAEICSTGEQKTIMMGITFCSLIAYQNRFGIKPILLLDEVFSHLDENRKTLLLDIINEISAHTFLTATNIKSMGEYFDMLRTGVQFVRV